SDDPRAGTLSRGFRRGRRRPSTCAGRACLHDSSASSAHQDPRARQEGGGGARPGEPPELVEYVLPLCNIILVMTVNPGFGGQTFLPEMLPKIRRVREMCTQRGLDPVIEVDGGENQTTVKQAVAAGATVIVAGSAIFGTKDYNAAIAAI